MTKKWLEDGSAMLSAGLTVPVPYEHDFTAHPMTPKEKLLNNAGEVKEYRLKDVIDEKTKQVRKDVLFGVVDVQDDAVKSKIGKSIRWTSPWITSFTDGQGKQWNNVIGHLALTTRPRVTKQAPFGTVAAALSMATDHKLDTTPKDGFCLTRATRLVTSKKTKQLVPQFPMAFSLVSGAKFATDEKMSEMKEMKEDGEDYTEEESEEKKTSDIKGMMNPMQDAQGDVKMEELLCDLLGALGVQMPENCGESEFKRCLYEATMSKVKELASKAQAGGSQAASATQQNTTSPAGGNQPNPLIQQEQQPMFMSLEDINKITDNTMKAFAMSVYTEHQKMQAKADANEKLVASLRDAELKKANAARNQRILLLGSRSPKVKADLEAMVALPAMALSMGEGGAVVDPMSATLDVLDKGLSDLPRLLTTSSSALSIGSQPTDEDALTVEQEDELADRFARNMGCPPKAKAS
jgi:hypothetical protein